MRTHIHLTRQKDLRDLINARALKVGYVCECVSWDREACKEHNECHITLMGFSNVLGDHPRLYIYIYHLIFGKERERE